MPDPFGANECEAFNVSSPNVIEYSGEPGSFDSAVVRCAVRLGAGAQTYAEIPDQEARTEGWLHWEWYHTTSGFTWPSGTIMELYDSSGVAQLRITHTYVSPILTWRCQTWNGSAWVNVGTTVPIESGTRYQFDLNFDCGNTFTLHAGGSALSGMSGALSGMADMVRARFYNQANSGAASKQTFISQVLLQDEPTIGHKLHTAPATANGFYTDGTGSYTDIDEMLMSDADVIALAANGEAKSFTSAARVLGNRKTKAIIVSTRSRRGETGPANLQGRLRIAGSDYDSPSKALSVDYQPVQFVWAENPATTDPWLNADAEAATLDWGVEANT